ncbi:unnamed protein product, partial [Durusdinium trenchii]
VTAEQLKLEAVQQGPNARAWLRRKLNTFSAKVAKDSVDGRSPLAALGAEVGVEDCLSKKALIERMIAVLLPEESLDSSAAVQRHAWRLLRSCLGRQAAGEQIDADFLSTEVVDADLRLKLLAWCLCIPMDTLVGRHYSSQQTLLELIRSLGCIMTHFNSVSDVWATLDVDLQKLDADAALQRFPNLEREHVIALLACVLHENPTVRMERQWNEPTGFEDQEDVLEAVLQILHGRRATVETDGKSRKRKGALDDADKAFLRGLMRRYGLELIDHPEKPCLWQEVFTKADFLQTLWFVIQRLLHPRASGELTALRCLHQPDRIAALRASRSRALRRNGVHADVLSLHQELLEWQMDTGTSRLPNESEDRPLSSKIDSYKEKDRRNRISSMKKAYPPDFEPLEQLSLDCLTGAGDSSTGVQWRSEFEEQLMLSVPGWTEDAKKSRTFHTLQEVLQCGDVFLQQCFATLQSYGLSLQRKLSVLAAKLQCTPSIPGVAEAMSTRLLSTPQDTEEMELNRYVCRLCDFQCADKEVLQEHIKDAHSNDTEVARAWVEYRKK